MKLILGLLSMSLVLAISSGVVHAEDVEEVAPGERVEMLDVGLALTLPAGWQFEVMSASSPDRDRGSVTSSLVLTAEEPGYDAEPGLCVIRYIHLNDPGWHGIFPLDVYVNGVSKSMPFSEDGYAGRHEQTTLDLPAGEAIRIEIWPGDPSWPEELDSYYFYSTPTGFVALNCWSLIGPADGWLSVAETLELLPGASDHAASDPVGLEVKTGPVVRGGRLEAPAAGYALEIPDDWYGFDLAHPDLLAEAAAFDAVAAGLGPRIRDVGAEVDLLGESSDLLLVATQFSMQPNACSVMTAELVESVDTNALVDQVRRSATERGIAFTTEPEEITLALGRATVIRGEPTGAVEQARSMAAYFIETEPLLILVCDGPRLPDDHWLSIAETLERLPET